MRGQALRCALAATVIGLTTGCGDSATTSSPSPDPDVAAAKKDLFLAYRTADTARLHGLRCSVSPSPACHHPRWYPSVGTVVAEVGSEKFHQLTVAFAASTDQVVRPGVTYIVKTRRKSVVLAQKTNGGSIVVLHGSPSGSTFAQPVGSDWSVNHASTTPVAARPPVSVPDVRGMPLSAARRTLENAKLGWSFGYRFGEPPAGSEIVRGQNPPPGTSLRRYKPVQLYLHRK
jgi:hypothetical protein